MIVANWLNAKRLFWLHVPNGGSRNVVEAAKLKRMGVRPGCPDFLILSPPKFLGYSHVALELKSLDGVAPRPTQVAFLKELDRLHWLTGWFRGADAAIKWLEKEY